MICKNHLPKTLLFAVLPALCFIFSLSGSYSASATTYSQATVDFYTDQQRNATVNLPWQVNPGTNTFYLNNIYLNDYDHRDSKLAYISGRVVNEFRPRTTDNFYVCGIDTRYSYDSPTNTKCYGMATIVYENGYTKVVEDLPVYFFSIGSPYSNIIYFDFNTDLQSDWVIDWIQFRFYSQSGYDVVSRNVAWNNTLLFTFWEARSSISAYETPPTGTDVSNELLQQQIGQNDTIINQQQQQLDYITDTTAPTADTSVLSDSAGWLPAGPVDSILTLPISLLNGIVGTFSGSQTCSPVNLPLPFLSGTLPLPCVSTLMSDMGISPLWNVVGGIIGAFIIWNTLKWLYKFVDDTLSMRENESSIWGGL